MGVYQIRRKGQLEIRRLVVGVDDVVRGVGHVDVAKLEVPEPGDRDQEVPRQHSAHAQVAKDDAESSSLVIVSLALNCSLLNRLFAL